MAKNRIFKTTTINTTDANPKNSDLTIPANTLWGVTVTVVGRDQANSERASYRRYALVYRAGAGAVQEGATQTIGTDIETKAGLDTTLSVTGNEVRVTVTGLTSVTFDWTISWDIVEAP